MLQEYYILFDFLVGLVQDLLPVAIMLNITFFTSAIFGLLAIIGLICYTIFKGFEKLFLYKEAK